MRPRSSRSHSTLVPADSMIASTPHVTSPACDQATIGNVPCSPRAGRGRAAGAAAHVEHAAGAERDLGPARRRRSPGRRATPAGRRRGRRSAARRGAPTPRRRRRSNRRSWAARRRHASSVEDALVPVAPVEAEQPGDGGVEWSVTWTAPPDSSTRARCRRCRSRGRGRGRRRVLSSSHATLVADWFGASARPCSALAVMHSTTVRRSCQPSAGPIGSPVARSHTTVLARWLVIPTALTGSPAAAMRLGGGVEHEASQLGGVELDEPGDRRRRREGRRAIAGWSVAVDDRGAQLVVPTSMTRIAVISGLPGTRGMTRRRAAPGRAGRRRGRRPSTTLRLNISANQSHVARRGSGGWRRRRPGPRRRCRRR